MNNDVVTALLRDEPSFHVGGTACWSTLPESLEAIRDHVGIGARTVETGCGASTVVFAAQGSDHVTISPDAREHEGVRRYCKGLGVDTTRVRFLDASSDVVLPQLFDDRVLDFAFIDGAHSFPYPVVDWHYISSHLKIGGRILLDDIQIRAVAPAFRFMRSEDHWELEAIFDDRAALFRLVALPPPEDYVAQKFNRHADFSFAPLPRRFRLEASTRIHQARRAAARRYPAARDAWKRAFGGSN